jgi:hypothetical protein
MTTFWIVANTLLALIALVVAAACVAGTRKLQRRIDDIQETMIRHLDVPSRRAAHRIPDAPFSPASAPFPRDLPVADQSDDPEIGTHGPGGGRGD